MERYGFDPTLIKKEGIEVIYLAGGCFWGMEKLMSRLPGIIDVVSGYANGTTQNTPTYDAVCRGGTGFKETVRVEYNPQKISLEILLNAFFTAIDPTLKNQQGNDIGGQYQTGVYYSDNSTSKIVEQYVAVQRKKHDIFEVESTKLINFYDAEEYHQDYLEKNPKGYCHIPSVEINEIIEKVVEEVKYIKPKDDELKSKLTDEQYNITQKADTEKPFSGKYWDNNEKGIYVDITTGQPLFASTDKYDSSCGWPSFCAPIDENALNNVKDYSHGMKRIEVRSILGNAHLGHMFDNDSESPNGVRYCINSASLKFIPVAEMKTEGYEKYIKLFN